MILQKFSGILTSYSESANDISHFSLSFTTTHTAAVSYTHLDVYKRQEGDGNATCNGYRYCFVYEAEDILPVLNEQVNPYNEPLTEEDLHLMVPD